MSQQKFASNVVEKCLAFGTPEERNILVNEMLGSTDENEPLQVSHAFDILEYVQTHCIFKLHYVNCGQFSFLFTFCRICIFVNFLAG